MAGTCSQSTVDGNQTSGEKTSWGDRSLSHLGFNTLQAVQDFFHQRNIIINEYQNITSSKFSESFPFEDFQWSSFSSLIHWLFGGGFYLLLWPVCVYLKHPKPILYIWSQRDETSKQRCISSIVTYHQTLSWWQPLGPCLLGVHPVLMFVIHAHNSPLYSSG